MKKTFLIAGILTCILFQTHAGGLITNSNQSAAYLRMLARGASTQGDAVYYNPAGLAFLDEGLTLSLNWQVLWMERTLKNDLQTLNQNKFVGKLFVPIFPGAYAAYKTGDWTFSLGFNPPAGGGGVEFKKGLPMLEMPVSMIPAQLSGLGIPTTQYAMESHMKGSSIVFGVQAGATYKINEKLGVFAGIRTMFANNSYEGYLRNIMINPIFPPAGLTGNMIPASAFFTTIGNAENAAATADQSLDVTQKGSGVAPIFGIHFRPNSRMDLAVKYEFKTKITLENETKEDAQKMYPDGQKLRSDIPALLSIAGSYDFTPKLKVSVTYMQHFEKQARLDSWNAGLGEIVQRQKFIDHGTRELMVGAEYQLNDKLTLSAGYQLSSVGVSDKWQNDLSHNLDNLSFALGFAYRITEKLTLNFGAIATIFDPPSVTTDNVFSLPLSVTQKYERSSRGFAIGVDYRF